MHCNINARERCSKKVFFHRFSRFVVLMIFTIAVLALCRCWPARVRIECVDEQDAVAPF